MEEEKISPELRIAMNLSEMEREKSLDLNVGYSEEFEEWELIVRYTGSIQNIREELQIAIVELLGGYAVIRIPQYLIGKLSEYPQIDYIEKPKSLVLQQMVGITASCINPVRREPYNLRGRNVLVACLDSGADMFHPDFRNADGSTRIAVLWDQTVSGNPPVGFEVGSVYGREDINRILETQNQESLSAVPIPGDDVTGHGTAVLGIMAGNGNASGGEIVGVKMAVADSRGFPRTTQLMTAIDFAVRYAISTNQPMAINISFGNNYGAHNGDSILERYMDTISNLYTVTIISGTGNDGTTARHAQGMLRTGENQVVEIYVGDYLTAFNLQIWKHYMDDIEVELESPTGRRLGPFSPYAVVQNYSLPMENIAVYYSEPTPYNPEQEIYLSFIARGNYLTAGIWKLHLRARDVVAGDYDMWLPVAGSTTSEVSFVRPTIFNTLVVPSTARYAISVSAYDSINDTFANFSGRGPSVEQGLPQRIAKPDLAAPGVNINTCAVGGGYGVFSGTSFAAPFVAGAAALLMQYGIVEGNDPYLYGEKVRASLIKGARPLPFQEKRPSPLVGWGALCVKDSLPEN